tara:strand:- start:555 stop:836 length:282 start_codon:yes stop_codon:yes gene_type:complete
MGTPFKMKGPSLYSSPAKQKDKKVVKAKSTDKKPSIETNKTSLKNKAKSAWYTSMHSSDKSSTAEQWKTYKEKKKEFRDSKKTGKDVSWKSGF